MQQNFLLHKKVRIIHFLMVGIAIVLFLAAARWQILATQTYQDIADGRVTSTELTSLRGSIYTQDGTTLAYSEPRFDVYVWMEDVLFFEELGLQTREEFVRKIAPLVDTTAESLREFLETQYESGVLWIQIGESINAETWQDMQSLTTDSDVSRPLRGFTFQYTSERVYPEQRLAAHIVGLTNNHRDELYGLGGIEGALNGDLNPRKGFEVKEADAAGQAVAKSLFLTVEPKQGSSVYLTIDTKLQQIIEQQVQQSVERFEAKSGSIIVMDSKTGALRAVANYPTYDPNLREEEDPAVYTNQAISIPYEIGSIGKVFTLASVLEAGLVDINQVIQPNGHEGCEVISKDLQPLCTWDKKPQPPMPAWECLVKSDNLCFYHMALQYGTIKGSEGYIDILPEEYAAFHEALSDFGLGAPTGIDLTGEDQGSLKQNEQWTLGDVAAFSYGHGYTATPLQAISAVSVIPNYGIRMRPQIIDRVEKGDGEIVSFQPQPFDNEERVISADTAELLGEVMHNAYLSNIRDYETWYHDLRNYHIGMKSGTALIAKNGVYTSEINATQVGFDLSPERSFIMLVKLEEPQVGDLSFYNSRIMWLDAFAAIKDHLSVPRK